AVVTGVVVTCAVVTGVVVTCAVVTGVVVTCAVVTGVVVTCAVVTGVVVTCAVVTGVVVTCAVVTSAVVTSAVVTIRVLIGTHVHRSSDDERNLRVGLFNALGEFEGAGRRVFPGRFAVVILDLPIQGYLVGFPRAIREGRC